MRVQYEDRRSKCNKGCAEPSLIPIHELVERRAQMYAAQSCNINQEAEGITAKGAAPSGVTREKLYSAVIAN